MNALSLAVGGDHHDVVKVLVDEFNVPLTTKGPVSIDSFKVTHIHQPAYMLVNANLCKLLCIFSCHGVTHSHAHSVCNYNIM